MRSAVEIVRRFGLRKGDLAIVILASNDVIRNAREEGTAKALEEGGRQGCPPRQRRRTWAADPNLAIPVVTAAFQANPTAKAIVYPGGQMLGNAAVYMKAAGKKPGEVFNIGFDTSPQIVEAFKGGWVQLTADQQPFQQGYLPILSLCEQIVYGLAPINVDTGAGFVTPRELQGGRRSREGGLALKLTAELRAAAAQRRAEASVCSESAAMGERLIELQDIAKSLRPGVRGRRRRTSTSIAARSWACSATTAPANRR